MNEQNLDINLIIQSFQEKLNQLTTELVVKEATIKQLTTQLEQLSSMNANDFITPSDVAKKVK